MLRLDWAETWQNHFIYAVLGENNVARDFQMNKRKRNNTEQSDLQITEFVNCSSEDKLNLIFHELRHIRENQE